MRPHCRKAFLLCLFLLGLPSILLAQTDDASLIARIQRAALQSALDSDSAQPFHLKLAIHLEAQHGRPAEDGTVELWWSSPKSHRTAYDFPSYKATFLETPDGHFESPTAKPVPYFVQYMLDQVLHPIPLNITADTQKPGFQKRSFGKINLDCISVTPIPKKPANFSPLPVTYCFDPASPTLRLILDHSSQDSVRRVVGNFRSLSVPIDLDYTFAGKSVVQAHVEKLSGQISPYPETSDIASLLALPAMPAQVPASVVAGSIVTKVPPSYPVTAMRNRIAGSVLLHAIIGVDGKIKNLELIGSPDDSLTDASIDAVRQWVYKPYLLNGVPTEVDSTITVNFAFGR